MAYHVGYTNGCVIGVFVSQKYSFPAGGLFALIRADQLHQGHQVIVGLPLSTTTVNLDDVLAFGSPVIEHNRYINPAGNGLDPDAVAVLHAVTVEAVTDAGETVQVAAYAVRPGRKTVSSVLLRVDPGATVAVVNGAVAVA